MVLDFKVNRRLVVGMTINFFYICLVDYRLKNRISVENVLYYYVV